jgi:hypothetical protein
VSVLSVIALVDIDLGSVVECHLDLVVAVLVTDCSEGEGDDTGSECDPCLSSL